MAGLYPRNMVPLDDDLVRLLSSPRAIALYLAALEAPVARDDLLRITGMPRDEAERLASDLVAAGLLDETETGYVAGPRHLREEDMDAPNRVAFRLAIVNHAQNVIDEARHSLRVRGDGARAGLGIITLPDDPDILAQAVSILAETEDQLRALVDETASAPHRVRVLLFTGSAAEAVRPS